MSTLARPTPAEPSDAPAHALAETTRVRGGREVRLPAAFARAAVERLLAWYGVSGEVVEGPLGPQRLGRELSEREWALVIRPGQGAPLGLASGLAAGRVPGGGEAWVYPKHVVVLGEAHAKRLLRALEDVKPEAVDARGRPLPWVLPKPATETIGAPTGEDDDATLVADAAAIPPLPDPQPEPGAVASFIASDDILRWYAELAARVGADAPLSLARGRANRLGFTSGRVFFDPSYRTLRVHLTTCPNADRAEITATILHELAHPLARERGHGDAFKRTLVDLAAAVYGDHYLAGARAHLASSYTIVDYWVAAGVRAALRGGEPPTVKAGDDGQLARILTKVRKLRELARNQLGLPEAIAATATANDLVTMYELGTYEVRIDASLDEQMVDRWVLFEDGAVWRRILAHAVARYCDVFSLAFAGKARMHFFGRHCDVVAAEYLYAVSAGRIERECQVHLGRWRRARRGATAGETTREKTSFCDSAAVEFRKKLESLCDEDGRAVTEPGGAVSPDPHERAEDFARIEHARRGLSWGSGGGKSYRDNAAGRALGQSMEVLRGLDGGGGEAPRPKALPRR